MNKVSVYGDLMLLSGSFHVAITLFYHLVRSGPAGLGALTGFFV